MAEVPQQLVATAEHFGTGFAPVMDFAGWRVAISRGRPDSSPAKFQRVQRHNETNEVFILTQGQAQMVVMAGDMPPTQAHVFQMQPNVVYNVQQGVWHSSFLSPDAHIVIFERADTGSDNSDTFELDADTIATILRQVTVGK